MIIRHFLKIKLNEKVKKKMSNAPQKIIEKIYIGGDYMKRTGVCNNNV